MLPIYPDRSVLPGLGFSVKWSPIFINMKTATAAGGADIDLGLAQYPLHDFELTYNFLRDHGPSATATLEFKAMMGFFLQIGGSVGRFLFQNPDDHQVAQQPIGTGDGTTTTFTFVRTFGARGYGGTEPVGMVDQSQAVNIYLDSSAFPLDPSLYTLQTNDPLAQTITFATAPTSGQPIAADFSYFYYCKLSGDSLTFEKFMDRLWMLKTVKIHSCRPGA